MSRIWFLILLAATSSIIAVYLVYGLQAFVFPIVYLSIFFLFFYVRAVGDSRQADAIHRLEKLPEPDLAFSRIYTAWLYVTDKKRWIKYNALFSFLYAFILGSVLGSLFLLSLNVDFTVSLISWLLGMFITLLTVIRIAKIDLWTKTEDIKTTKET